MTVMGDRSGFVHKPMPANNYIDELVSKKLERMKIVSSDLCTDAEFIRRIYLDLTGLPPSSAETQKFLDDPRETRVKRDALIDQLVGNDAYIDHWTNKWADLLLVNRKFLGVEGSVSFRKWIHGEITANTPYDEFARTTLLAGNYNTLPLDINAQMTQRIRPTLFALGTASTIFSLLMIGLFLAVYTLLQRRAR